MEVWFSQWGWDVGLCVVFVDGARASEVDIMLKNLRV